MTVEDAIRASVARCDRIVFGDGKQVRGNALHVFRGVWIAIQRLTETYAMRRGRIAVRKLLP